MSLSLRIGDGDTLDVSAGTVHVAPDALDSLGVEQDDAVELRGETATVARVGAPFRTKEGTDRSPDDLIYAGEDVRTNAGVETGDTVEVTPVETTPAERVELAPTRSVSLEGGIETIRDVLADRPLRRGDRVRLTLFGGSMSVTFVVVDALPEGPVVINEDTDLTLLDADAARGVTRGRRSGLEGSTGASASLPEVSYDDVGGLTEELRTVRQLVEAPLGHPELYDHLGGHAPNGVLLYGPSGGGKTLLAAAVADGVDAHVVAIPDPEHLEEYGGDGEQSLDDVARQAVENAPSLVVFDDLDALAPPRSEASSRESRALSRLVSTLDQLAEHEDVVVLGTTNRVDEIADPLRRGGRFDREVEIGVPDRQGRREIFEVHAHGLPVAEDVELEELVQRTHGFVGADIETLITEAVRNAIDRLPPGVLLSDERIPDDVLAKVGVTAGDFDEALSTVSPSAMRDVEVERPTVTYDDIGGLEEPKHELLRAIEWPIRHPNLFQSVGVESPKGLLLYGPPGTGKTMLVKATANASDANFLSVNGPELLNKYVGESEKGIREVFDTARQNAPTIVFFDEVDAIASERGDGSGGDGVIERVVSQLLTELDGMRERDDVVVVGATNRPDMVDPALLRPGRFEKLVEVPVPDRVAREEIFEVHTGDVPLSGTDPATLAERTGGYTGSDIEAVVREATMFAMEEAMRAQAENPDDVDLSDLTVDADHFDRALESIKPSVPEAMRRRYDEMAEELR